MQVFMSRCTVLWERMDTCAGLCTSVCGACSSDKARCKCGPTADGDERVKGRGAVVFFPLVLQPVFLPEPHGSCQSQDFHVKLGCLQKPSAWVRAQEEACKLLAPAPGNDKADGWTSAHGEQTNNSMVKTTEVLQL